MINFNHILTYEDVSNTWKYNVGPAESAANQGWTLGKEGYKGNKKMI